MGPRLAGVAATLVFTGLFSLAFCPAAQSAEDFYQPPVNLPNDNGALIRQEPTSLARVHIGDQPLLLDGKATRILYRSTDQLGRPVAVSGTYIEPNAPWQGSGPRPLVSFAVGTQGVGDGCAPSKTLGSGVNLENGHVGLGYEIPAIDGFIKRGIAVVVTDYLGLGTPDRLHTYINRLDQGHAVLDAARAALALPGVSLEAASPIGFYGYSQGGSGAGAAAELAQDYAPELNVKGAYVGAPASDLTGVLETIDGSTLAGVVAWEINGLYEYYPKLPQLVNQITNEDGQKWLKSAKDQCIVDAIFQDGFRPSSELTRSGQSLSEAIKSYPEILTAMEDQRLGKVRPPFPVMVLTGTHDDAVGHDQARRVAVDWCSLGGDVTYRPVDQPIDTQPVGIDHLIPIFAESSSTQDWLIKRLQGEPAQSNCAGIDSLP